MWRAFAASLVERRTGGGAVGAAGPTGVVTAVVVTAVAVSVEGKGSGVGAIERR